MQNNRYLWAVDNPIWSNLAYDENINFLKILTELLHKLDSNNLRFNLRYLQELLKRYPELDQKLSNLFKDNDSVSYADVLAISLDELVVDFLIIYAVNKKIYEDNSLIDNYSDLTSNRFLKKRNTSSYFNDIKNEGSLSDEESRQHFIRLRELRDEIASEEDTTKKEKLLAEYQFHRNILWKNNLRLVIYVVNLQVADQDSFAKVSYMDLIQEGNIGLMKAVERFDYDNGCEFSTYAIIWIRQAIERALANQSRTIRIPVYLSERINKINMAKAKLTSELGREVSIEEIADACNFTCEEVRRALHNDEREVSYEETLALFADKLVSLPGEDIENSDLKERINLLLESLNNDRERRVLEFRYGFEDGKEHTLEETGEKFGLSKGRINQIELKALRRLRHPARRKLLTSFGDDTYRVVANNKKYNTISNYVQMFDERKLEVLNIVSKLTEKEQEYIYLAMSGKLSVYSEMLGKVYETCEKVNRLLNSFIYDDFTETKNMGVTLSSILDLKPSELTEIALELYGNPEYEKLFMTFGPLLDKRVDRDTPILLEDIIENLRIFITDARSVENVRRRMLDVIKKNLEYY